MTSSKGVGLVRLDARDRALPGLMPFVLGNKQLKSSKVLM